MRVRAALGAGVLALVGTVVLGLSSAASAAPQALPMQVSTKPVATGKPLGHLQFLRTATPTAVPAKAVAKGGAKRVLPELTIPKAAGKAAANQPSGPATVPSLPITGAAGVMHQTGLTGYDQEAYGGYALEPPDSEIAAGNGTIVQVVNNMLKVWDSTGHELSPPIPLEYFFFDFVNFLTDPKVYWDQDTKHYFLTEAIIAADFTSGSGVLIAVSQTGNPLGNWNIYFMDTTDPFGNHACPCVGDQPLLGADKWTLQISTNEYDLGSFGFNGAQMYFLDKTALAMGLPVVNIVGFDLGDVPTPDGACPTDGSGAPCWYSVQPAESPNANYDLHANGASLALSTLDFFGGFDNRIAAWLFTNTKSISSVFPVIGGGILIAPTGTYTNPPPAVQPDGPHPFGEIFFGAPVGIIETNDDRMNEVEYNFHTGWLMGGLNTGANVTNASHYRAAVMTQGYKLQWIGNSLFVVGSRTKYIANLNADVLFPSSATTTAGNGLWSYTLTGDTLYPSSAISPFPVGGTPSQIRVTHPGVGPEDGPCEYDFGCDPGRWGDYSGTATDGNRIYWTNEYIAQKCTAAEYINDVTCGGTRGFFINWANSLGGAIVP
jgi:hypothetical protein